MLVTHDVHATQGSVVRAATRRGSARVENEDCYDFDLEGRWFIVADGVGGNPGGAEASRLVCDLLAPALTEFVATEHPDQETYLRRVIGDVVEEFEALRTVRRGLERMATTIVVGSIVEGRLYVAWMGDSRAHLVRGGRAEPLTRDHRLGEGMVARGVLSRSRRPITPGGTSSTSSPGPRVRRTTRTSPASS